MQALLRRPDPARWKPFLLLSRRDTRLGREKREDREDRE
jgi:hypothetical protein